MSRRERGFAGASAGSGIGSAAAGPARRRRRREGLVDPQGTGADVVDDRLAVSVITTWQNRLAWLPSGVVGLGLDVEDDVLGVLGDRLRLGDGLVGQADQGDLGLAREVLELLDLHEEVGLLALLDRGVLEGEADVGLGDGQLGELGRDHHGARGGAGRAVDDDLPVSQLGAAVGVDGDEGLVLAFGDRHAAGRAHAGRNPGQADGDGGLEVVLTVGDDLQVHRAVANQRRLSARRSPRL